MSSRVMWIGIVLAMMIAGAAVAAGSPASLGAMKADLAKRVNVPVGDLKVLSVTPQVFPDASLGLARPDEMSAQVITPGFSVQLQAGQATYLYTATDKTFRYGGPLDSWKYSALYVQPVADEPNLNGNLMQVSLAGTNPTIVLPLVSDFWAQNDGSILAKRRMSRSGHELLYLAPGKRGEAKVIQGGFDVMGAAKSAEGEQWCAFKRMMVGAGWEFVWGKLDGDPQQAQTLDLPADSKPVRTYWHQKNPVIAVTEADHIRYYELDLAAAPLAWKLVNSFFPPENDQWMLNKSETLVVKSERVEGKMITRVIFEWFTGDEKPKATIENFEAKAFNTSPGHRFLLLSGTRDDKTTGLTVDLSTHEVLTTVGESQGPVQLFLQPPDQWLRFSASSHRLDEKGQ